jgi:hypothetical protein
MSSTAPVGGTSGGVLVRGLQFAAASAVAVFGIAGVVSAVAADSEVTRAVWTSAALAFGVQLLAFVVAWPFLAKNPLMGWGIGSVLRLIVLVLYALVGIRSFGFAPAPALLSLAGFFFVSMLLESLFLKP